LLQHSSFKPLILVSRARGVGQYFGSQNLYDLFRRKKVLLDDQLVNTLSGCLSFESKLRSSLVADVRVERGYQSNRVFNRFPKTFLVGGNARDASSFQSEACLGEVTQALEETISNDWLKSIQLKLPITSNAT
jgi:hypothetical protein